MDPVYAYDEVHVISDLHLGGSPTGRQIFDLGTPLARLIDHLTTHRPKERLALVINGDLVDFIAEPNATYFDPDGAVATLDRIMTDDSFKPVFQTLTRFVQTPGRHLALTLGNHDIELALPWVRKHLLGRLSGDNEAASSRIITAFDGTGFLCSVGDKRVLCVHGNEVDAWNITDYETLRRKGRDLHFGQSEERWIPNGGTQMVIDVMNSIKIRHPFVDLLKPETKAVIPVLLALDARQAVKIAKAIPAALRRVRDRARMAVGLLGEEEAGPPAVDQLVDPLDALEGILQESASQAPARDRTEDLLASVEQRLGRQEDPFELAGGDDQKLGYGFAALKFFAGDTTHEVLREALQRLKKDRSFDHAEQDDTFKDLDRLVGPAIDFVIAGHTHLERAIRRPAGGVYYNGGTWVRLIQLDDDVLGSETRFTAVYNALAGKTMAELDEARVEKKDIVQRRPAVVSIWQKDGAVRAEIRRVSEKAGVPPHAVDGSRYPEDLGRG